MDEEYNEKERGEKHREVKHYAFSVRTVLCESLPLKPQGNFHLTVPDGVQMKTRFLNFQIS